MKTRSHFTTVLAAILLATFFTVGAAAKQQLWTCGMHPQIIKTEPGNCPICGMKLTPIRDDAGSEALSIHIDAGTIQRMNLKTGVVTRGPVRRDIRNVGTVAYDEKGLRDITTKYEGWIEHMDVDATWTPVIAGEPLFEIYSPDAYNAQLNYLVARRTEGDAGGPLTKAALARLNLLDVDDDFVAAITKSGEPKRTLTYRAPMDGVVIEKMGVAGQMMKAGERIYRLADLSTVWVEAQIFENDLPFVHEGQAATVRLTYGRDKDFPAKVQLVLPQVEARTRTATARLVLENPDLELKPGMFVDVRISAQLVDSALLVPEMAVLRSGERNTVFIAKADGAFEPREVKLGLRSQDGNYEVLSGLEEGDHIVTSGQFMLDSESQLREAIQKMVRASAESEQPKEPSVVEATGELNETATKALTNLALQLADASTALGNDNLDGYVRQLPSLRSTLSSYLTSAHASDGGPLAAFASGSNNPTDIAAARLEFAVVSTAITDLARSHHIQHRQGLHVFECPMAPGIGKGRWLQRDGAIKNPFYGAQMPDCGEELDAADARPANTGN